jgi:hypothetical protein
MLRIGLLLTQGRKSFAHASVAFAGATFYTEGFSSYVASAAASTFCDGTEVYAKTACVLKPSLARNDSPVFADPQKDQLFQQPADCQYYKLSVASPCFKRVAPSPLRLLIISAHIR